MRRFFFVVLVACATLVVCEEGTTGEGPEVVAPIGRIRGSIIPSRKGRDIYSFRGIRYGEPPVGQQRFQVAVPAADWNDTFDASEEGPSCPSLSPNVTISEDCLRLNVYSTKLPSAKEEVKRPVMVFIHPGGFYSFSGQSFFFGPQYICDKDIVLVTINYRLGSLGFFSTGDSLAPGNLGYKDQVVALRWVQRNIAAFGGDPNSVTLVGYSAGSVSLILHLVSPMSKGLFHRGIGMSASPLMTQPLPTEQKHLAKKQAELLGCPTDTTGAMLICLNSKPVENFTSTMSKFFEWYGDPILVWNAVVEPEVHGVERFLPAQPIDLIRQGKFHKVPLILGVTKDEFGGVVVLVEDSLKKANQMTIPEFNENWDVQAPISFLYERNTPRSKYISAELRKFYFGNKPVGLETLDGLAHIYADSVVTYHTHRAAKLIADNCDQPVYFYKFTYQGRYSFMMNGTKPYGVVHHDDMQYLFYMSRNFPFMNESDPEVRQIERSTAIWTNFMQTGKPIPQNNELLKNVVWERFSSEKDNYLDIGSELKMERGLFPDRMQEWERLFPLWPLRMRRHYA